MKINIPALVILLFYGCGGGDIFSGFGHDDDRQLFWCRSPDGSIYDDHCNDNVRCPTGWTLVPSGGLPDTCCTNVEGNTFLVDAPQCAAEWTTEPGFLCGDHFICGNFDLFAQ